MYNHGDLVQRIKGEYEEMPGLRLTESQARRLWGMPPDVCTQVLAILVDEQFLQRTHDGAFMRR